MEAIFFTLLKRIHPTFNGLGISPAVKSGSQKKNIFVFFPLGRKLPNFWYTRLLKHLQLKTFPGLFTKTPWVFCIQQTRRNYLRMFSNNEALICIVVEENAVQLINSKINLNLFFLSFFL